MKSNKFILKYRDTVRKIAIAAIFSEAAILFSNKLWPITFISFSIISSIVVYQSKKINKYSLIRPIVLLDRYELSFCAMMLLFNAVLLLSTGVFSPDRSVLLIFLSLTWLSLIHYTYTEFFFIGSQKTKVNLMEERIISNLSLLTALDEQQQLKSQLKARATKSNTKNRI